MEEVSRDVSNDFVKYEGQPESLCSMNEGKVLILYPRDAHKVKVKDTEEMQVEKVVIKVKI